MTNQHSRKQDIRLYLKLVFSSVVIIWGCEYLTAVLNRPDLLTNWLGPVLIIGGTAYGSYTCYIHRRGATFVGIVLLLFVGVYAWNLSYYYDPGRVPGGTGPPVSFFAAPAILTLLGVFFLVFFRYLYPDEDGVTGASGSPGQQLESQPAAAAPARKTRTTPWYRLLLLGGAVVIALLAGYFSGVETPAQRTQIILTVLVLGCVATGLITEETLTKIIPWKKE